MSAVDDGSTSSVRAPDLPLVPWLAPSGRVSSMSDSPCPPEPEPLLLPQLPDWFESWPTPSPPMPELLPPAAP
jgi:hypothetical protein